TVRPTCGFAVFSTTWRSWMLSTLREGASHEPVALRSVVCFCRLCFHSFRSDDENNPERAVSVRSVRVLFVSRCCDYRRLADVPTALVTGFPSKVELPQMTAGPWVEGGRGTYTHPGKFPREYSSRSTLR